MGGIRARKNNLIVALKAFVLGGKLTQQEGDKFEEMYRRCRTEAEQDQVSAAMHHAMDGWKEAGNGGAAGGVYGHLRRLKAGIDLYTEDDDDDPPALKEALARARVDVRQR